MFSGLVKAIDPLGSAYKFHDYFQAFNLQFLIPFALPLAILLCTAEFISGFSVLSGYRQKTGIIGVMILMLIFTPLTLVLALTNPVSDCGCFGDAIHLTNWQTFGKNIVLMIFAVILFAGRTRVVKVFKPLKEWILIVITTVVFIVFSLLNLKYLPLIDFLPYKSGVNIADGMKIPEGVAADKYETTFIYEKNGVEKEFTLENYPASDSSWKFIDQKSVLVEKGYQPPIHDFSISLSDGSDITDKILADKGFTLLLISKKLEEAKSSRLEAGFELGNNCMENGISFYVVTASVSDVVNKYNKGPVICTADETTLKTIVRANPGYLLISNGNIAGKWSWANVPAKDEFSSGMTADHFADLNNRTYKLAVIIAGLAVILILLLIGVLRGRRNK
jgi:triosephosphate isomerase